MNRKRFFALFQRTWKLLSRRRRKQCWLIVGLISIASIMEMFTIGAIVPFLGVLVSPETVFSNPALQPLIGWLGIQSAEDIVLPFTLIFCGFVVLSAIVRFAQLFVQTRIIYAIGVDLSTTMYRKSLYQPLSHHTSTNTSEVLSGISNKSNEVIVSFLYPSAILFGSMVSSAVIVSTMIYISPVVSTLTLATFGILYLLIAILSQKLLTQHSATISNRYADVVRHVQEGLGGIRDILIDGSQERFVGRYRVAEADLRNSLARVQITRGYPRFLIDGVAILFIALLSLYFATRSDGFESAVPIIGMIALSAQRLTPLIQQVFSSWAAMVGGYASVDDGLKLAEKTVPAIWDADTSDRMRFDDQVSLEGVEYHYNDGHPVLSNIRLTIQKGARVGIIGPTGSGKSTLLDLVMGLISPSSGKILVDGVPLSKANARAWQGNIAHVPQAIFLPDTSIAESIAFGVPPEQIDEARLTRVARDAQILDFVNSQPNRFATPVGERGAKLSGGQRQRIGIARALYKQASVIVLDEATSALDGKTENAVMDVIDTLPDTITLLVVAHRLTTLRKCTEIIRLDNGELSYLSPTEYLQAVNEA